MRLITNLRGLVPRLQTGLLNLLATKFHYLLLLGIIAGIAFTAIIHRLDFAVRGLIFFIPAILVSALIYLGHFRRTRIDSPLVILKANQKISGIVFSILFTLSLLAIYLSPYRPWYYFALVVALFGLIFLQIFSEGLNPYSILIEISCVMGNLIFGLQLKYPFFFGFSDIIPHLYISKVVFLSGHTIPIDLDSTYATFPLFHIFIAIGKSILGVELNLSFIILTSISFIVLLWVVYLLAHQIHPNTQLALLICLVFATTPVVITYSTYVVTRVMAFVGFIFLIFLAQRKVRSSRSYSFYLLLSIMALYIILVHQVSILQIIPLLVLIFVLEGLVNDYITIEPKILALIIVAFSAYWVYISTIMSEIVLAKTESITAGEIQQVRAQVQVGNEYLFLWNNIDIAITIFLVMVGVGYLVWAYRFRYPSLIGIFTLIMIPLFFPSPVSASSLALITFRTDRLALLVAPFFAIVIGIGLMVLLVILYENRYTRMIGLFCGLTIFSFLCLSALTDDNASDCVDLSSNQSRVYFTQPEMNSFDFVTNHVTHGSAITSDRYAGRMFENKRFSKTQVLDLPFFGGGALLASSDRFSFTRGFYLFRYEEFRRAGLRSDSTAKDFGDTIDPTSDSIGRFQKLSDVSQRIFDNRDVVVLSTL